jgi:Zn-dependent peptidase ImmA (M78 family)/transcriptional regulator with XRE-family HTH domain
MKPSTPGFIGNRLKEAREARALSMQGLADLLEISRQSISKYESGSQSPSPTILDEISRVLKIPRDYFVNERPHDNLRSDKPIYYRKLTAADKVSRFRAERRYEWLQDISHFLGEFVEFPDVNFPLFDPPNHPNLISNSEIEHLALRTRRFWGLGDGPISNVVWLLENNGAIVGRFPFSCDEIDAFSQDWGTDEVEGKSSRPHIVLGSDKQSTARSRFDAAHELGHLVIHKNITNNIFRDSKFHRLMENQANLFAGAFLFPRDSFIQEVADITLDSLRILKPRWKLSIAMLLHRAHDLHLIHDEEYKKIQINLVRRGWKKQEPLDEEIPPEEPKLLQSAMKMIIEEKICSSSDVLTYLKLNHTDIEEIIGLPSNYLGEKVKDFEALKLRKQNKNLSRPYQEGSKDSKSEGIVLDFSSRQRLEN